MVAAFVALFFAWSKRGLRFLGPLTKFFSVLALLPIVVLALSLRDLSAGQDIDVVRTSAAKPPVLLIVVDTLRADHTTVYGYDERTTPHLQAFSEQCTVFTNAHTSSPWTRPSVTTLLTGLPPDVHNSWDSRSRLPGEVVTLPEIFRASGYRTGLFSDSPLVSNFFGFGQGFSHIEDRIPRSIFSELGNPRGDFLAPRGYLLASLMKAAGLGETTIPQEFRAEGVCSRFLRWLDGLDNPESSWFAYLHFIDPHHPYETRGPDGTWVSRTPPGDMGYAPFEAGASLPADQIADIITAYDAEIRYWDVQFGRLIEDLRQRKLLVHLVVVVTADHGEQFGEHQLWGHGNSLYETLLRVPLLLRSPGSSSSRKVDEPISLEAVMPILLNEAGFRAPNATPGLSRTNELYFYQVHDDRRLRGILKDGVKWILSDDGTRSHFEAYDLRNDPAESHDLADSRARQRTEQLLTVRERIAEEYVIGPELLDASGEVDKELDGLGYLR